jgi:hypothetical protein
LALLAFVATACEKPATQLIVVVDRDYAVPGELGFIRVMVKDEAGAISSSLERELIEEGAIAGAGQAMLPGSFAVVPKDGDAGRTVVIEVEGRETSTGRVRAFRRAVTGFRKGKRLLLRLFLARSCEGMSCDPSETCAENGCVSETVSPNDLPEVTPGEELIPRDAGVDAGTDAGMDAGDDAGMPDGGDEDAGCPPPPGAPAVIATVQLPHGIEGALLAADLDGDGVGEILAADRGEETFSLSVIDFDACGAPNVVSTSMAGDLRRAAAFVEGMSGPEIWLPTRNGLEAWRYSALLGTPLERTATIVDVEDLDQLSISSDGLTAGAIVRHSAWGMAHVATLTRQEAFRAEPDRPRNLAYLGEVAAGALFAGASPSALYLLEPGRSSSLPLAGLADPMSIGPDAAFGGSSAVVLVARADRAVVSVRVDLDSGATVTSSISFPATIRGEPLLMRAGGEVRLYVRLETDLLTWCTIAADAASVSCTPANPADGFDTGETEDDSDNNLLTAYLDDDAVPDLVVLSKDDVQFRSGLRPADPAASVLRLNRETKLAGALLPRFWEAFGASGDLLAIPFEDGSIRLISWAKPAGAPTSGDELWTQPRRDARRSGHLP